MSKIRRRNRPHLYIMRGLPGSRKSKLARKLREAYRSGVILSTDDYFKDENGKMHFERMKLQEAHQWNRERALEAMKNQFHPVIIDNTNISRWEMEPYVKMGLRFRYFIIFYCAPDSYRCSVQELHRRSKGKVPLPVIKNMKRRFEDVKSIYDFC